MKIFRPLTRRRLLQATGVAGIVGLTGCSMDQLAQSDSVDSDDSVASDNAEPSGESTSYAWESFEYSSLAPVMKRHSWDNGGTVRILEDPEVAGILEVDQSAVTDFVEYVEETDFADEFVVALDLSLSSSSYALDVRDVVWESDEEVAIHVHRTGESDDSEGQSIVTAIRISRSEGEVPTAARVAVERGSPRNDEDEWRQLATYSTSGQTGFSMLMEDENGELVAQGYPSELTQGQAYEFVFVIENYEAESQEYTLVTQLQRVNTDDGAPYDIEEREELDRFTTEVEYGNSTPKKREIRPTLTGEDLRLAPLLYKGDPPAEPTKENAYQDLALWVDVVA